MLQALKMEKDHDSRNAGDLKNWKKQRSEFSSRVFRRNVVKVQTDMYCSHPVPIHLLPLESYR